MNFVIVALTQRVVARMGEKRGSLLGAYFTILMRTSALFIGAIGIEMILSGLEGAGTALQRPPAGVP